MQFEWNSKDIVSFELYNEVIEKKAAQFYIWLESENKEINIADIRNGGTEYRFNNFIIKENKDSNSINLCPNIAGCPAYIKIKINERFKIRVIRKDGTLGAEETLQPGEIKIELDPAGMRMYKVSVKSESTFMGGEATISSNNDISKQDESVPEFFGGFFSSQTNQASSAPKSAEVVNNPFDDANIFPGGFNSESFSTTNREIGASLQTPIADSQATINPSSNNMPLFANMFPTAGDNQGNLNQNKPVNTVPNERINEQQNSQNFGLGSSIVGFHQDPSFAGNTQPSGSVAGFSVPYVETEGIRERRDNIQQLQLNNDRTAQEVEQLEKQIAELENKSRQLYESKNSLISHLEILQREFDKDYSKYQADIDEIKGRYTVDQSIIEYYKDKDLVATETLLRQTDELVNRVEEQIRLFVTAQQNKSDEIEKALKVGKKE